MAALALLVTAGCGDNEPPRTAVGPAIELPLLVSTDPATPFQHSAEVSVAARNGRVAIVSDQLHLAGADTYAHEADNTFPRRVAVSLSEDGGQTFSAAVDPIPDALLSSDPVVRASKDGTLFVSSVICTAQGAPTAIFRSEDGRTWRQIASSTDGDKEWLAIDDLGSQIYLGHTLALQRFDFEGAPLGGVSTRTMSFQMADAYADANGVHFATGGAAGSFVPAIVSWDGVGPPHIDETLDAGAEATMYTASAWSIGPLPGGRWAVYTRCEQGNCELLLRVENAAGATENALSAPGAKAFLPTAVLDDSGRLHVAWYDSSGPSGELLYTHSRDAAPFAGGFIEPIVIDPEATPGDGWYPGYDQDSGDRRLREYIGIASDGDRVHVAWTHSPAPPSRVYTTTIWAQRAREP